HTNEELGPRVDDGEVIEIVVVEAQLADRRDQDDLPEPADCVVQRAVNVRGREERPRDEQRFESEDRQASSRDLPVEHLHARSSPSSVRYTASLSTAPSSLP